MPPLALSVVICAHNPRPAYLERTLAALREQTLALDTWELLLVDNASGEPLAPRFDLSWQPQGRHLREDRLGLAQARVCGIDESRGSILVFVDDDNVLIRDYLATAVALAGERPWIGAWGGRVEPEFESPPPPWLAPYLPLLAVNRVTTDQWSNFTTDTATPPCGAGMCVRRPVAEAWRTKTLVDPRRSALGRSGTSLASGEDIDLAFTACDLGYGTGRFTALRLTHLIPRQRLELGYILRLVEGVAASQIVVRSLREPLPPAPAETWRDWLRERWRDCHRDQVHRKICAAERRGLARGRALVERGLG